MDRYYYALFLSSGTYIEKCLSLIKFVNNKHSKSLPHITLRLLRNSQEHLEYIQRANISSLNIISPGTFNMDGSSKAPVVFLQCESKELEFLEHKPKYPLSRLHITMYEGSDIAYAQEFYELLKRFDWQFELVFSAPVHLSEERLGKKIANKFDFEETFEEIVGESFDIFQANQDNPEYRLRVIKIILNRLNNYNCSHSPKKIDSLYSNISEISDSKFFVDASSDAVVKAGNDQVYLDEFGTEAIKMVQKAIFITPPEYAHDMAVCALDAFSNDGEAIDFGDSAIGTGTLFLALQHLIDKKNNAHEKRYTFRSAIGIDNDQTMAQEAFVKCSKRGLKVIYGDALSPYIDLGTKRNLMIVNPPYNRYQDIPENYRKQIGKLSQEQTGIHVPGDAGLYVYHMLIMDKWLNEDGVAVWLIPTIFLQARYGEAIRNYLLNRVQLLRLHIYDEQNLQFDNTMISTTIVVFRKSSCNNKQKVAVSYGSSLRSPNYVDIELLRSEIQNWRRIIMSPVSAVSHINSTQDKLQFQMLFDIKRGLATGANSFFVLNRDTAKSKGIPDCALRPVLPKARFLESLIIEAEQDGYPRVAPQLALIDCDLPWELIKTKYPQFYNYLCTAREQGIIERTLVKSRNPWYKQERRDAPPFLLTYMGRNKKNLPPLYFVLNKSQAVALNTYILLYPKPWLKEILDSDEELYKNLLSSLNNSASNSLKQQTRVYSGGLQKLEPNELKELPITAIPEVILQRYREP